MRDTDSERDWSVATVQAVRDLSPTVRELSLVPSRGVLHWQPGSHLPVQLLLGNDAAARPQTRSYSLIGEQGDAYRIAVKRLDQGRGGSLAMWRLAVGDRLAVGTPQNHFTLDLAAPAYLLVAGGIGVTPLLRMAQVLSARGVPVRMLFAARNDAELVYADSLRDSLNDGLRAVTSERGERLDFAAEIEALPPAAQAYVCGPSAMRDALLRAWQAAGRPAADLRYETFGSSGSHAPQAFRVRIPRHALDITVAADCSLLDALEQAGVATLFDCRRGECGLCAMDVLAVDGQIDHRDVFLSAPEKNGNRRICACVSRVVGSVTLDTAWRPET